MSILHVMLFYLFFLIPDVQAYIQLNFASTERFVWCKYHFKKLFFSSRSMLRDPGLSWEFKLISPLPKFSKKIAAHYHFSLLGWACYQVCCGYGYCLKYRLENENNHSLVNQPTHPAFFNLGYLSLGTIKALFFSCFYVLPRSLSFLC